MDAARRTQIQEATKGLNPETDFIKNGQPNMTALKALVPDITKEERDEIWPVAAVFPEEPAEKAVTFDTTGATSVVTHRDGGPKKVWFRDGKEIGVENVG